jgi:hypothetical protein
MHGMREITAVIGLADRQPLPCPRGRSGPGCGGPERRRHLRPTSPRPAGPAGLRRPGAADRPTIHGALPVAVGRRRLQRNGWSMTSSVPMESPRPKPRADMAILQSAASPRLTVARIALSPVGHASEREVMRSLTAVGKVRRSDRSPMNRRRSWSGGWRPWMDSSSPDRFPTANHREPLCYTPFLQVALDRKGRS